MTSSDEIPVLGLKLDRKIDLIALTAFILALASALLQLLAWARGPVVTFFAPERVVFYASTTQTGRVLVRVAATMSYTNSAGGNYSAILRNEAVTFSMGALRSTQTATSLGHLLRNGSNLAPEYVSDAAPQPLRGGDALSHTTFFSPDIRDCLQREDSGCPNEVTADAFSDRLARSRTILVSFGASFYKGRPQSRTCRITVTDNVLAQWFSNSTPWLSAPCRPIVGS